MGLAAASIVGIAAEAQTQRYYMRERIAGLKAAAAQDPTYDGVWSSGAWTDSASCVAGSRSQTRSATCSTSSCDPSTKPTTARTTSCTMAVSDCTLTANTSTASATNFRQIGSPTGVASLAAAKAACDALPVGLCYVDYWTNDPNRTKAGSGTPYWVYAMDSGVTQPFTDTTVRTIYAGTCRRL